MRRDEVIREDTVGPFTITTIRTENNELARSLITSAINNYPQLCEEFHVDGLEEGNVDLGELADVMQEDAYDGGRENVCVYFINYVKEASKLEEEADSVWTDFTKAEARHNEIVARSKILQCRGGKRRSARIEQEEKHG